MNEFQDFFIAQQNVASIEAAFRLPRAPVVANVKIDYAKLVRDAHVPFDETISSYIGSLDQVFRSDRTPWDSRFSEFSPITMAVLKDMDASGIDIGHYQFELQVYRHIVGGECAPYSWHIERSATPDSTRTSRFILTNMFPPAIGETSYVYSFKPDNLSTYYYWGGIIEHMRCGEISSHLRHFWQSVGIDVDDAAHHVARASEIIKRHARRPEAFDIQAITYTTQHGLTYCGGPERHERVLAVMNVYPGLA